MRVQNMERPSDKHIDDQELSALLPPCSDEGQEVHGSPSASIREAERHLASCAECRRKLSQYRQVVNRSSNIHAPEASAPQPDCPTDVDWDEVAAGLWPELKTQQLITHAARCAYCGPLLRAAATDNEPTPQEEELLAQLKAPSRPALQATKEPAPANHPLSIWRELMDWRVLVPVGALLVLVAVLSASRRSSSPLSGLELAQFAAST